jgi:hypothetical protein
MAALAAGVMLAQGCVIVVDGTGETETGWASSWESEREAELEANQALAREVTRRFAADPLLKGLDIEVAARGGAVALHGRVPDTSALDHALKVAAQTPGVETVMSRLSVEIRTM